MNSWEELILRSELILIKNDHHLDGAMPLLPHVVTVGGITARPPQPLADDLERIMAAVRRRWSDSCKFRIIRLPYAIRHGGQIFRSIQTVEGDRTDEDGGTSWIGSKNETTSFCTLLLFEFSMRIILQLFCLFDIVELLTFMFVSLSARFNMHNLIF
jgi:hypothetical protein